MKKFYFLVLFLFAINLSTKGEVKKIGAHIFVHAHKLNEHIKLDGILSEHVYNNQPITGFTQKNPNEGKKPSEKTYVWVSYDESAIYVSAMLFDVNPDSVVGLLSRRDDFNESDWFGLYLDPYHDKQTGYEFGVNAAGSIVDGTLFNDSWDDLSWNGIWDYAVNRNDKGWSVEIRIPFNQLRFNQSGNMIWGINFYRKIQRENEEDYFIMVPKKESGFVSHFAQLDGLNGINPKQRIELLPYVVSKAQYLVHEQDDPFYKGQQYQAMIGGDIKIGLGSNLTLDATINPDFGQVEVDPAVVNLSAFETYYDEKRPFFIEGNNIFMYGYGGTNSNWGFNWGNPELFYSRRIGRSPHGSVDNDSAFVDEPKETRIIAAAKVTGKIGNDWSIGAVNAITAKTYARLFNNNITSHQEVEPLTNYTVIRGQKEFESGKYGLGFIGTSVVRKLDTQNLNNILSDKAFVYGIDGWATLDDDGMYVMNGYASGSYSHGTKSYITDLQQAPLRYYQRPDSKYLNLDSSRTSLAGFVTRVSINKQKGNFYINSALGLVSPGYEANDVGFQWRANVINSHLVLGYRWFNPGPIFRSKEIYLAHYLSYNFDGNNIGNGIILFSYFKFLNYYGFNLQAGYSPDTFTDRLTRGGPIAVSPSNESISLNIYSDSRKSIVLGVNQQLQKDNSNANYSYTSLSVSWKPNSQINFSVEPFYEISNQTLQWVDKFEDSFAVNTYGTRYVLSDMSQKTIGASIRLDWTFTPKLSLQLYLQPLFSVGHYSDFKELGQPGSYSTNIYGKYNSSTISYDNNNDEYRVDPDGNGPANSFTFSNPDFNFKSLRGNVVLRWELLPGSVLYLVWTHGQTNTDYPGHLSLGRDFRSLWNSASDNILQAKFTYWLDL